MKRALFKSAFVGAVIVAVVAGCLCATSVVLDVVKNWPNNRRFPIGRIGGVVASDEAVFVAARTHGRVYKFDLNGRPLRWWDLHRAPIVIFLRGDVIAVQQGGTTIIPNDFFFQFRPPSGKTAVVRRSWLGHPLLIVADSSGTRTYPLQPWYVTAIQMPYPGLLWLPLALAASAFARKMRRVAA